MLTSPITLVRTCLAKDSVVFAFNAISSSSTLFPSLLSLRVSVKTLDAVPSLIGRFIAVLLEWRVCEGKHQHKESEDVEQFS